MISIAAYLDSAQVGLDRGYQGLAAAMCDWWVRPCGVCGEYVEPRECIPETIKNADLARLIVKELKAESGIAGESAHTAVNRILRAHYPCAAQGGSRD